MSLRYRMEKPSRWLEGLLIVLALLGHDLLMASRAPVPAMAPATGTYDRHRLTHPVVDVTVVLPQDHPESPHPSVCGIGGMAVLQSVDQLGVSDLSTPAVIAAYLCPTSAHTRTFLWEEPSWPPGTRRALLQVYRI
jgi:hypothetical protein